MNTKSIKAFKIISSSMAYWRGDSQKQDCREYTLQL